MISRISKIPSITLNHILSICHKNFVVPFINKIDDRLQTRIPVPPQQRRKIVHHPVMLCRSACPRVYNMGVRCGILWALALTAWLSDRLFCRFWLAVKFPYMHSFWHVLVFVASTQGVLILIYHNAREELPEANPKLSYWPSPENELVGIPYVSFQQMEPSKLLLC